MEITREINGEKIPIALSDDEMHAVFLDMEHEYALQDMRTVLTNHECFNESDIELVMDRDELVADVLRLYEKYLESNSTWYDDMIDAITENMDAIKSLLTER